ncbi:hypothetical protein DFH07DRAFT_843108 [Mycena maculata]|uniref:Cytochrome b5 heme-binding domain-containing protein n=1 Tax=Mycena maculata TaxID=230809 RepID=A0AAD7MXE4_9AGAR|nr:hypothetical protein DFH07DRAFT_843108 [Mycena maculata]
MPTAGEKKYPLILPPPQQGINADLDARLSTLPVIRLGELTASDDEDLSHRTLVGLKGYVFDLTTMHKSFESDKPFRNYASKDISYALTKYSTLPEDVNVSGYNDLSPTELETLDNWVSVFLLRFAVVGTLAHTT